MVYQLVECLNKDFETHLIQLIGVLSPEKEQEYELDEINELLQIQIVSLLFMTQ